MLCHVMLCYVMLCYVMSCNVGSYLGILSFAVLLHDMIGHDIMLSLMTADSVDL
jgi:hypothetical protein